MLLVIMKNLSRITLREIYSISYYFLIYYLNSYGLEVWTFVRYIQCTLIYVYINIYEAHRIHCAHTVLIHSAPTIIFISATYVGISAVV